jgi:hypothetical protein
MPSWRAAAVTLPCVRASASRSRLRSTSPSTRLAPWVGATAGTAAWPTRLNARSAASTRAPRAIRTACSMTLRSSRTLPGQEWPRSAASAEAVSAGRGRR